MKPNIIWLKWVDPLGRNKDEFPEFEDEVTYEASRYESGESSFNEPSMVALCPAGIIPLKPYNNPAKAFNWWMLHTGFTMTKRMAKELDKIDGVEILDFISNNRARIAIGIAYEEDDVKHRINKCLTNLWELTYNNGV